MADEVLTGPLLRFGVFELDRRAGELRKSGVLVHLPPQPFDVLALLASHPGQIVTRDEIRRQIWGDETYVDFEQGLNHCVRQIRAALGGDAETPRYVETLPRRGYRFIAPVEAGTSLLERRPGTIRTIAFSAVVIAALLGALLALNVAGLRNRVMRATREPPLQIHSIAVLPLENLSGDPEQEYFADGMTDELITELSTIGGLRVIARSSVMRYKGAKKPLPEIARELNVDALIEASVLRSGNRVRINAQLVDGSTERILWTRTSERDLGDVLVLQSEVALSIAREIRITVTPEEQKRLAAAGPVNTRAYESYLRGRYLWNKRTGEDMRRGLDYFEQAVKIDPNYATAYAGIADSYLMLSYYGPVPPAAACPKARAAADESIMLDGSQAESHTALAAVSLDCDWDWSGAEREFRRAIVLNSNYATAHQWYSKLLMGMGHYDEALAESQKARERDPLELVINTNFGSVFFLRGEYNLAIKQWESIRELDPNFWMLRLWLGWGYLAKGFHEDGLHELELAVELSKRHPSALGWLGYGYAISGKTAKAREILTTLHHKAKEGYVPPYDIALVHAGLGEKKQAFEYLEKAFQERSSEMLFLNLKRNMLWRPLHSDPRYHDLLRRMNFPKVSE